MCIWRFISNISLVLSNRIQNMQKSAFSLGKVSLEATSSNCHHVCLSYVRNVTFKNYCFALLWEGAVETAVTEETWGWHNCHLTFELSNNSNIWSSDLRPNSSTSNQISIFLQSMSKTSWVGCSPLVGNATSQKILLWVQQIWKRGKLERRVLKPIWIFWNVASVSSQKGIWTDQDSPLQNIFI